ncbi:MAG: 6-pyruvoyl trahydropterin synthase family protein [Pseudobdellovibrio sp.]
MTTLHSTLHLAKQNFKFSSAHFLIFDETSAEMLHGHNYQVKVDLTCASEDEASGKGYAIDFHVLKKIIKEQCDQWDEHILLPEKHKDMQYRISQNGSNYEIHFRERFYSFPIKETIWLPVNNTSVENLSALMAKVLLKKMSGLGVKTITVFVEETLGQSASSTISV